MAEISELEDLGKEAMKDFFGIDNKLVESMNVKQLKTMTQKAKLGFQFFKEVNVQNRSKEQNTIRICTMLADNREELKRLLRASLPKYVLGSEQ